MSLFQNSYIRKRAADALGQIGNPQAVDALITAVHHSDSSVRQSVIKALDKISNLETLDRLIKISRINVYDQEIFPLARTLAVRHSKAKIDFIPVYPEKVRYSPLIAHIKSFQRKLTIFLRQLWRKIKQAITSRKR